MKLSRKITSMLAALTYSPAALAQGVPIPDSDTRMISEENIDPITGQIGFSSTDFIIGDAADTIPIKFERIYRSQTIALTSNIDPFGEGWSHSYVMGAYYTAGLPDSNQHSMVVIIANKQYRFGATLRGGVWSYLPAEKHGGTAESQVISGTTTTVFRDEGGYTYYFPQDSNHTVMNIQNDGGGAYNVLTAMVDKVKAPNGEQLKFFYSKTASDESIRLDGFRHSRGYGVILKYLSEGSTGERNSSRQTISRAIVADTICTTFPYGCDESSFRKFEYGYSSPTGSYHLLSSVKNPLLEQSRYGYDYDSFISKHRLKEVYLPADGATPSVQIGYGNSFHGYTNLAVTSISLGGNTTTFTYPSDMSGICAQVRETKKTAPNGGITIFKYMGTLEGDPDSTTWCSARAISEVIDPAGGLTQFRYTNSYLTFPWPESGGRNQRTRVINPEGDYYSNTIDSRGNIVSQIKTPKPGSGVSDTTTSSAFPDCTAANFRSCNKPAYIIDARGNRTDYTWDDAHGGATSIKFPADSSGLRPEKSFQYGSFTGIDGEIFFLPITQSEQIDSSSIVTTSFEYAPANGFRLKGKTVASGGEILRYCYTYDAMGRQISETLPASNLGACP